MELRDSAKDPGALVTDRKRVMLVLLWGGMKSCSGETDCDFDCVVSGSGSGMNEIGNSWRMRTSERKPESTQETKEKDAPGNNTGDI